MPVENDEVADRRLIEQQHRFRGLVAEFKSRRFIEDRKTPRTRRFRSNLSHFLLDTRAVLQHYLILEWITEMTKAQLGELAQAPVGYDNLSGIYLRAPVVSLDDELLWLSERLRTERTQIAAFLAAKAAVEPEMLAGRYHAAIEKPYDALPPI